MSWSRRRSRIPSASFIVEDLEVVIMGVPVELGNHSVLKPAVAVAIIEGKVTEAVTTTSTVTTAVKLQFYQK